LITERIGKDEAPDRGLNCVVLILFLNLVGFGYGIAHEIWEEEAEMLEFITMLLSRRQCVPKLS